MTTLLKLARGRTSLFLAQGQIQDEITSNRKLTLLEFLETRELSGRRFAAQDQERKHGLDLSMLVLKSVSARLS